MMISSVRVIFKPGMRFAWSLTKELINPYPYFTIAVKTTDENLTSENWELILNLCDKVQEEGEQG